MVERHDSPNPKYVSNCVTYKKFKKSQKKYGKLPVKEVTDEIIPRETVQIATIGPYPITTKDENTLSCLPKP